MIPGRSAVDPWAACVRFLEAHCHQGQTTPYNPIDYLYCLVLWTFCAASAARTILEIGIGPESVSGTTFLHWLGLSSSGGHLISVDVDPDLPQTIYRQLASDQGVPWTIVHGDSLADAVQVPCALRSVDLLYIDGNHDAEHAEGDLRKFLPYLRAGGYCLIDDFPAQKGVGEGRAAIDALIPDHLHLAHNAPAGNGRLVWQRPV